MAYEINKVFSSLPFQSSSSSYCSSYCSLRTTVAKTLIKQSTQYIQGTYSNYYKRQYSHQRAVTDALLSEEKGLHWHIRTMYRMRNNYCPSYTVMQKIPTDIITFFLLLVTYHDTFNHLHNFVDRPIVWVFLWVNKIHEYGQLSPGKPWDPMPSTVGSASLIILWVPVSRLSTLHIGKLIKERTNTVGAYILVNVTKSCFFMQKKGVVNVFRRMTR